jgi:hypothetical protein
MTDKAISELTKMIGTNVDDTEDTLPIVDASQAETKRITRKQLFSDVGASTFSGTATFQGSTSGISYTDLNNLPVLNNTGIYRYPTRAAFVAAVGSITWADGDIVIAGEVMYIRETGCSLSDLTNFTYFMHITPLHHGATGDGVTDDRLPLQDMIENIAGGDLPQRIVDLAGLKYMISSYLYIGRFDWNQDGTYDKDTGPIANLKFVNGTLLADPTADWTSPWPETNGVWDSGVPMAMIYVGDIVNTGYVGYRGSDEFDVLHITFECEFQCSFKTGGLWIENTHRVIVSQSLFYDIGIDCWGVASPQSVDSPRGYTPINQQTIVNMCRFEGNRRSNGIMGWPGKEDFNGGSEVCAAQAVTTGSLTINGVYTSGGEFTSDIDEPMFIAIQNVYDATLETDYEDMRGVNFLINGFSDFAKTNAISETMIGPRGGRKTEWSYSKLRYAVISSIVADTTVPDTARSKVLVSTDYRNGGIRIGTHDAVIDFNNFTATSYAAVITGRAGSFSNNHPWSRYVLLTENSTKFTLIGNYLDYSTLDLFGESHLVVGNANKVGNPAIYYYPNKVDDDGFGTVIHSNSFTQEAKVYIEDNYGSNNFDTDKANLRYSIISMPSAGGTGYTFVPGLSEFGSGINVNNLTSISDTGYISCESGATFGGYLTCEGAEFNRNVNMKNNRIYGLTGIGLAPQATEPTGGLQSIAISSGLASTNGFGGAGFGLYIRNGSTWSKV